MITTIKGQASKDAKGIMSIRAIVVKKDKNNLFKRLRNWIARLLSK